jgi:hypothetical protein
MPGGRQRQQDRVDIGGLQVAQHAAGVSQCGDVYGTRLVHGDDQSFAPEWE